MSVGKPTNLEGSELNALIEMWTKKLLHSAHKFDRDHSFRELAILRVCLERLETLGECHEDRINEHTTQDQDHGQQAKEDAGS